MPNEKNQDELQGQINSASERIRKRDSLIKRARGDGYLDATFISELTEIGDLTEKEVIQKKTTVQILFILEARQEEDKAILRNLQKHI
jgi:hypothetical protein